MSIIVGIAAIVAFLLNVASICVSSYVNDTEAYRWAGIEAALYLLIVAVCFK